jgi:hypothetical protein
VIYRVSESLTVWLVCLFKRFWNINFLINEKILIKNAHSVHRKPYDFFSHFTGELNWIFSSLRFNSFNEFN